MKPRNVISLILILGLAALPACGKSKGGDDVVVPPPANAAIKVDITPSKKMALANGSDAVTMQADVRNADSTAVPDGTTVNFSVPAGTGVLSASTAVTANGLASVTLTRAPISGANNQTLIVTAAAGGVADTEDVKFINQPAAADVSVSLGRTISNLGTLQFNLNNEAGASMDNNASQAQAMNTASGSLVAANFNPAANSTTIGLVSASGVTTGTSPILRVTFAVAADAGMPAFSIDQATAVTATDSVNNPISPALTAADLVVTVKFDTE
jgi:hypothetical protein